MTTKINEIVRYIELNGFCLEVEAADLLLRKVDEKVTKEGEDIDIQQFLKPFVTELFEELPALTIITKDMVSSFDWEI